MKTVTGVVLAAGESQRMGEPKLLLPYRDTTILNTTVTTMLSSRVDRVIVVTGAGADAIEASLDGVPIATVRNPDYRRGNMSSLVTAVDADADATAFILVAGDLPTTPLEAINTMVDLWASEAPWAAVTGYRDRITHPFLLSRAAIDETAPITGEKVLWRTLIASEDPRVVHVPSTSNAPLDVNTPPDYKILQARPSN